jgi:hypothetical protein
VVHSSSQSFGNHYSRSLKSRSSCLSYHSQIDGQTERVNQVLEKYLRCTINYHQDNWTKLLPLAKFAYNNTIQRSIQQIPFFANIGIIQSLISSISTKWKIQQPETLLLNCLRFIRRRRINRQKDNADKS